MSRPRTVAPPPSGFSLVEILVSLSLISIALVGLVPLSARVIRASATATLLTQRSAALSGEVERVAATPFDSLHAGRVCTTTELPGFGYARCLNVQISSPGSLRVTVSVAPQDTRVGADSAQLDRTRETPGNPLSMP